MTANPPNSIARTFRDLSDKDFADIENASLLARWGMAAGFDWDELLKSQRILIMSEAGVGKTYECRAVDQPLPTFCLLFVTSPQKNSCELQSGGNPRAAG